MKAKYKVAIVVAALFLALPSLAMAQAKDEQVLTIKLHGGYNSWVLGSAALSNASNGYINPGYFSFGAEILVLNPKSVQIGVSAAYLPMLVLGSGSGAFVLSMIPVTADIVFNVGFFYTDIGVGAAFMQANLGTQTNPLSSSYSLAAPEPSLVIKIGLGFNIRLIPLLSLDIGAALYAPLGDFGFAPNQKGANPLLWAIAFSQLDIRAGLDFNF